MEQQHSGLSLELLAGTQWAPGSVLTSKGISENTQPMKAARHLLTTQEAQVPVRGTREEEPSESELEAATNGAPGLGEP